jgi:hypothetical protein
MPQQAGLPQGSFIVRMGRPRKSSKRMRVHVEESFAAAGADSAWNCKLRFERHESPASSPILMFSRKIYFTQQVLAEVLQFDATAESESHAFILAASKVQA